MFSDDTKDMLGAPLNRAQVKERRQGGRTFSYIEGWTVIAEANRIFGFDGWKRETIDVKCVSEGPREIGESKVPGYGVTYVAKVRVTVGEVVREGCGSGHGIDRDLGLAHESAIKEAETDAMKRALMTFGNPFGLALYDKEQSNVVDPAELEASAKRKSFLEFYKASIDEYTDKTKLLTFWNSDAQKTARRNYDLSPAEVEMLKTHVMARVARIEGASREA
ncbi:MULTISPECIES: RAD52 family DNA repair protein [Bradyrhizobium]|uniref:RAD52 family DNA repair protein n=1 Tax=Bradyrhizobium TaxID=374 RepID=UPI000416D539|nr:MULTISPECIES: RAD52 family DNA repair protein [Bradyrhizobium]MBR0882442.1 RAD52 family DNA repair protein [Bradyrhizobium liaoningense]MBR1002260.1 RAD52 family DNA repair protein [Bradyrhizobium liaoningense]MBR1031940.1 RAD52 family DNA repair protein [Bradyrhizobium liaoningense]MBR1068627.1 RAD52 family DNA repair protein [Bradyrhizobium liaoningense]MCP1740841.1 DNA recombination protein Rad52 [Bradyrhizobium japonicum]